MSLLILGRKEVSHIIRQCRSSELLANQAHVFRTLNAVTSDEDNTSSDAGPPAFEAPLRYALTSDRSTTLVMPARLGKNVTCKLVDVPRLGSGLSASTVALDSDKGSIRAVVNSTALTALRNAASE
jgi:ornithine cyclodeaminase/alanine dehydrogenase-like protein (mu-crystallin family)